MLEPGFAATASLLNVSLWHMADFFKRALRTSPIRRKADMHRNGAKWSMAPSVCNLSVTSAFTFSINTSNFAWVLRLERH